jgi:hypothetical protein
MNVGIERKKAKNVVINRKNECVWYVVVVGIIKGDNR